MLTTVLVNSQSACDPEHGVLDAWHFLIFKSNIVGNVSFAIFTNIFTVYVLDNVFATLFASYEFSSIISTRIGWAVNVSGCS